MIVGLDKLIQIVQDNKIKNFEVRTNVSDTNSTQLRTNDTMTPDEKINLLRSVMENNYGTFHLIGYDTLEKTLKGRYDITFNIRQGDDNGGILAGQRAIAGIGGAPEGYIQKSEVEQMLANAELRYQISGLKTEMESLKKEKKELESPINEFMRNLAPIAGAIAQNFMKGQAPSAIGELSSEGQDSSVMSETSDDSAPSEEESLNAMLNEALTRWHAVDSDCFILIKKIADLAENDPSTYNMAKTMLMSK